METMSHRPWTAESVQTLIRLAKDHQTGTDIAMTLDLPEAMVRAKAEEIGIKLAHFPDESDSQPQRRHS